MAENYKHKFCAITFLLLHYNTHSYEHWCNWAPTNFISQLVKVCR